MAEIKRPAAGGTAATGLGQTTGERREGSATAGGAQRRPRKWERVLVAFLSRPQGFNRFEAARDLRDWCLPSTVAEIQSHGVQIARKEESVPGAFGPVRCCRYWLAVDAVQRAREVLDSLTPATAASAQQNALTQGGEARTPTS